MADDPAKVARHQTTPEELQVSEIRYRRLFESAQDGILILDADVDFLVRQLRPTALNDLGLQDALINFAQNWSTHFGIPVEVLARGPRSEASTSEIDTTLYRIAQEGETHE